MKLQNLQEAKYHGSTQWEWFVERYCDLIKKGTHINTDAITQTWVPKQEFFIELKSEDKRRKYNQITVFKFSFYSGRLGDGSLKVIQISDIRGKNIGNIKVEHKCEDVVKVWRKELVFGK